MEISNLTFDDESKKEVLDLFEKTIDQEGFIVEKEDMTQRVLTTKGEEILFEEWGGVVKGSESFIKSDTFSLIELAKKLN
ncbi:hypothetical protein KAJ87_01570 [Candidatus Pacearchaeota archaeon]|nr:hypothetical protein [Candidatus Pacearchaeota archaeon]